MSVEGKPCIRCGSTEKYKNGCCAPCKRAAVARWHEANKERNAKTAKAWNEANKERKAATYKAWYEANKERKAATDKAWNEANKDKHRGFVMALYRRKKAKSAQAEQRALMMKLGTMLGD